MRLKGNIWQENLRHLPWSNKTNFSNLFPFFVVSRRRRRLFFLKSNCVTPAFLFFSPPALRLLGCCLSFLCFMTMNESQREEMRRGKKSKSWLNPPSTDAAAAAAGVWVLYVLRNRERFFYCLKCLVVHSRRMFPCFCHRSRFTHECWFHRFVDEQIWKNLKFQEDSLRIHDTNEEVYWNFETVFSIAFSSLIVQNRQQILLFSHFSFYSE